jgi:MFS family permease
MYSIDWLKVFPRSAGGAAEANGKPTDADDGSHATQRGLPRLSPTVWALGFTSLLTDVSSEMMASILPIYLVLYMGMSPLMFGVVDGIYQGAAAIVRVAAGVLADRWNRHKEVAAWGYGLSAGCRLLILAAGNAWGSIAGVIALDRVGKGIRTAPRDALIAQRSRSTDLATAFGVHRSMDATGAMLGPIVAFALLAFLPNKFDVVFVAAFGIALVGLGVILLFVPGKESHDRGIPEKAISLRTALGLLGEPRFRAQVCAATFLGLATISDSFVFLILQRQMNMPVTAFPLLYVGTALATAAFAAPVGRLADRVGRMPSVLGGYLVLLVVYLMLLTSGTQGLLFLVIAVVLFGIYYAATDGVFTAMAASILPTEQSGSGLAVLATASNLARLAASVIFGVLWSYWGISHATIFYLIGLMIAIAAAFMTLTRSQGHAP